MRFESWFQFGRASEMRNHVGYDHWPSLDSSNVNTRTSRTRQHKSIISGRQQSSMKGNLSILTGFQSTIELADPSQSPKVIQHSTRFQPRQKYLSQKFIDILWKWRRKFFREVLLNIQSFRYSEMTREMRNEWKNLRSWRVLFCSFVFVDATQHILFGTVKLLNRLVGFKNN